MILTLFLCQINRKFLGVHISFLMIDHVENQSILLIAANYIHMCMCVGYLYPVSTGVVQTTSNLQGIL